LASGQLLFCTLVQGSLVPIMHACTHDTYTYTHAHTHLEYGKAIEGILRIIKHSGISDWDSRNKPSHSKDDEVPVVRALAELSELAEIQMEEQ